MTIRKPTRRVSKNDWLFTALEELERSGIGAVRVERLANKLGVSRSGFYYHFADLEDLQKRLLEYWFREYTAVITADPKLLEGDAHSRIERVTRLIQENELGKYDLAIRAWAQHDERAREVVQTVTKDRMRFIGQIFADMGFKGEQLELRTKLFVCYHTWESAIFDKAPPRKRSREQKLIVELLTSR